MRRLQAPSGGFLARPADSGSSETPSLRATSAAIRALHYFGGDVPNPEACRRFVASCFDAKAGGFADTPGGKTDVFSTAVGAMAVVELKMSADRYGPAAVQYFTRHARSFEDIRIAAAAMESLGKPSPSAEEWLTRIFQMRNPDGTYGKGAGTARATGGAVAAVLRLGGKVEHPDKVIDTLKAGQRKTGGYGKEDTGDASDLETTYRVMRSLTMLKSHPDNVAALRAFIGRCRNRDGGYGVAPGQPSTVGGTYYAGSILHWLDR